MPFFRHPRIPSFLDEEDARRKRTTGKTDGRMANPPTNPFSGNLTRQAQAEKAQAARDRDRENLALLRDSDPVDIKYALELDGPEDRLAGLGIGGPRRTSQAP